MRKVVDLETKQSPENQTDSSKISIREELDTAQKLIKQYKKEIEQLKQDHATLQEATLKKEIDNNAQEISMLKQELHILQEKNTQSTQSQAEFFKTTQKLKRKNERLKSKNQNLEKGITIASQNLVNPTLSSDEPALIASLEKDIKALKTDKRAARALLKPILEEKNKIEKEITELTGSHFKEEGELTGQIQALVTTMQTLKQSNASINTEIRELQTELEEFCAAQQSLDRVNLGIYQTRISTVTNLFNMFRSPIDYLQASLATQVQKVFYGPHMPAAIPQHPAMQTLFQYKPKAAASAISTQNPESSLIKKTTKPGMNTVIQAD